MQLRPQSLGEEIANAVSHGTGALLAVAALPVLLVDAVMGGSPAVEIFAVAVFGVTMVLMYLASTLYHALPGHDGYGWGAASERGRAKSVFRIFDHAAIYLLIAGTYTPFALGVFREEWGWPMFGLVWTLALAGVVALGGTLAELPPDAVDERPLRGLPVAWLRPAPSRDRRR